MFARLFLLSCVFAVFVSADHCHDTMVSTADGDWDSAATFGGIHLTEYDDVVVDGGFSVTIQDDSEVYYANSLVIEDGVLEILGSLVIEDSGCEPDCNSSPCENGGTCSGDAPDSVATFECACVDGYVGDMCETDFDDCAATPCGNGAECVDLVNDYFCNCTSGWEGKDCETDVDDCLSNPCQNGATCSDAGTDMYTCACVDGYEGDDCEANIDDCIDNACENDATCVDGLTTYACECADGFAGAMCESEFVSCAVSKPCSQEDKDAKCTDGDDLTFTCDCSETAGFGGLTCSLQIDECAEDPCLNGGICTDGVFERSCECINGYVGDSCEVGICASTQPCINGDCIDIVGGYECDCGDSGYEGDNCDIDIDDCLVDPCVNGVCSDNGANAFSCACTDGYVGALCDIGFKNCSYTPPCLNDGICADGKTGEYTCDCSSATGWEGPTCGENTDTCLSDPCHNGGVCIDKTPPYVDNVAYECTCLIQYEGVNCETPRTKCDPDPCFKGDCSDDADFTFTSYTCSCDANWAGENCDTPLAIYSNLDLNMTLSVGADANACSLGIGANVAQAFNEAAVLEEQEAVEMTEDNVDIARWIPPFDDDPDTAYAIISVDIEGTSEDVDTAQDVLDSNSFETRLNAIMEAEANGCSAKAISSCGETADSCRDAPWGLQPEDETVSEEDAAADDGGMLVIIIIVCAVVALGAGGAVAWKYNNKNNKLVYSMPT